MKLLGIMKWSRYILFWEGHGVMGARRQTVVGRILKMVLPGFHSLGFSNTNLGTALKGFYRLKSQINWFKIWRLFGWAWPNQIRMLKSRLFCFGQNRGSHQKDLKYGKNLAFCGWFEDGGSRTRRNVGSLTELRKRRWPAAKRKGISSSTLRNSILSSTRMQGPIHQSKAPFSPSRLKYTHSLRHDPEV